MSELAFSHVALNCTDQQATEDFYRRWFGFGRARVIDGPPHVVFLRRGPVLLELFAADDPAAAPGEPDGPHGAGGVRHIAFQTDDVDAFLAAMGAEADVTLGPLDFDAFIPGWRTFWMRDPDGVVVEVSQGFHDAEPASALTGTGDHEGEQA